MEQTNDHNPYDMEDELCYAWEIELFDEDGDLWIATMMNMMLAPICEQMDAMPILMEFPMEVIMDDV
jgi:hypothetical protein